MNQGTLTCGWEDTDGSREGHVLCARCFAAAAVIVADFVAPIITVRAVAIELHANNKALWEQNTNP